MGPIRQGHGLFRNAIAAIVLLSASLPLFSQISVTTWRNDISRTGQNLNESILTPSNVNATQFGKLFSLAVDGYVYAEPLYMQNVTIGGASHNVIFVATENDSVYAFDADSNGGSNANPLWFASMLSTSHGAAAGAITVSSNIVGTDIVPQIGITGTPVIDPTSGTLYVVSATEEGTNFVQRLHALDITSGAEKFGGPVVLTATVPGTGNGSSGGSLTFDSEWQNQRAGLLLLNGIVYIGFGSHGDNGPWHGWILAYNAQTLTQTGAFCSSPNGVGAGIWMGGEGLAADVVDPVNHPYGRLFLATGNGDYTATKPYSAGMDFGDSVLNLDLTNGVPTVQDNFTPAIQANLDEYDGDQGSGGALILPNQTTGSYPHLLVQAGKSGEVYLLNRDNLGGYNTGGDQVVQGLPNEVGDAGTWTTPAYWNGTVYYWAQQDTLKAFSLVNGQLVTPPVTSSEIYGFPGANPEISANGTTNGIVWSIDSEGYMTSGAAILQAHNASSPGTTLYSSATDSSRDNPGLAVKFTVPTVANGKVYVGTQTQVSVFGLLNGEAQASAPVISPAGGNFGGTQTVTITDSTPGAVIYYTLDGSTPTVASPVYSAPFNITATTTVQAMATATGYLESGVSSETYTDTTQVLAPSFSPGSGTFTQAVSVTISDGTTGASIYYTTDGSTPTTSSTKYTGPVLVSTSETLSAIAAETGYTSSPVVSASYTISSGGTTYINYANNGFTTTNLGLNNGPTVTGGDLELTDGGSAENRSAWFTTPVPIGSFITNFTFQQTNATADGMTFTIQGDNIWALGYSGGGLGYQSITNSVAVKFDLYSNAGEGIDSTGMYVGGAAPTVPAVDLTSTGVNLHSGDIMNAQLIYDGSELTLTLTDTVTNATATEVFAVNIPSQVGGTTAYVGFTGATGGFTATQKVLSWNFTSFPTQSTAALPTFSPVAGTYTSAQSVTISDATPGTTIYYTTNGTTPTTSSTIYSNPIQVSTTETLEAIAVETGYTNSPVATAAYTISSALPAPTFSPAAGTYSSAQSVTISDSTAGTTIYYTTNGTTPTTSSTKYTSAVTVSSSETLEAIAVETGYTNSPVATAAYTISSALPAPTFSPAAGTYSSAQSVTISDSTAGTTIYYTTNGTTPTTSSTKYTSAVTVSSSETLEAIAVETGYTNSPVATAAYTISPVLPAPTFSPAAGTYTSAQTVSISDTTSGTTIYYTTNGTTPSTSSTKYTSAVTVSSSETLEAIAVKTGYTNSPVATAAYTISSVLPAPTFSPAAGTYTSAQTVSISDSTSGTTIYYTTNGTTPTTSSTKYTSAISVSSSETLEAIAVKTGYTNSPVATAAYTISPVLPAPTFSPAAGTYTSAQTVSISDTTSGTTIYYTTNGTTPTTSSTKYTSAISVSSSETLEAIAVKTGYTNSPVATAAYTISPVLPAPTFSPAAGTYTSTQTVSIGDATPGITIYYTTNGTTPTTSSPVYSAPLTVSTSETLEAIAVETGYANSPVGTAAYTISSGATTYINYATDGFTTTDLSFNYGATVTGGVLQLTDGGTNENRSAWFDTPVPVGAFVTDFTFQQLNAVADGMTFTIQGGSIWALGYPGGGLGYQGISNSVAIKFDLYNNAGEGIDSTGLYTDGVAPTVPATDLTSTGVNLHSADIMHAHLVYDGTNLTLTLTDTVTNAVATEVYPVNIPSVVGASTAYVGFTGGTGGSAATQNVLSWTYSAP